MRSRRLLAGSALAAAVGFLAWRMRRRAAGIGGLRHPGAQGRAPGEFRLSVVLPAFNEADRIGATLDAIRPGLAALEGEAEIIVVDDGSDDETETAALAGGADQVLVHGENRGKGAAVRTGMLAARGRTIVFTDADLAYGPEHLTELLALTEQGWHVVVGSRRHHDTETLVPARRLRAVGGRLINLMTGLVLVGTYGDTQSGLKGFRSDAARQIFGRSRIDGFAFDIEVFHLVERDGLSITEVPVRVVNSTRSSVHVVRDGVVLLRDLLRIRWYAASGAYDAPLVSPR